MKAGYHSHVRTDIFPFLSGRGSLLDVGGGGGATASAIRRQGLAERVGVADMVEPDPDAELDFACQGDLTSAAFLRSIIAQHGPFDTIIACDFLEHVPDPWTLVDWLADGLRPGGVLVASIPNIRHYSALMPLLLRGRFDYVDAGILDRTHLRFFTKASAQALLDRPGLAVETVHRNAPQRKRDRLINAATLGAFKDIFALQYIVVARRTDA